jgi:type VI secretion system secreted protein Hcp
MKTTCVFVSVCLCLAMAEATFGAETVAVYITGATQGVIQGDSTYVSLGRENSIEALSYTHMLFAEPDPRNGITGDVHDHFPVTITKRFDRATVKLFRAWCNRERLQITAKFFRPNPSGDGTTQQFYTVNLTNAYIAGIRREVPDALDPASSSLPPMERISFTYSAYEEVWIDGGIAYGDEWTKNMTKVPLCDVNFDGIVNMKDFAILANEWLDSY